jgi:transposase
MPSCRGCLELGKRNRVLVRENGRLMRLVERLKASMRRLRELLARAGRAAKRQAAPFSKGAPKAKPRKPGRRSGAQYGRRGRRHPPTHVDEVVSVPTPPGCPHCGGKVSSCRVESQFQEEIPPIRPYVTRFDVEVGRCESCCRRIQGRDPRQSSDALGAAAVHMGPRAVALAADLNKGMGISFGKVSRVFEHVLGLSVTASGLCSALKRLARAAQPSYQALVETVRQSPVVAPDETGWKNGGHLEWLWAFVTPQVTVYAIMPGRGYDEAASILGEDYSGTFERDGWAPYRRFAHARHQTCNNHLLRRCHELLESAQRGSARVPHAVAGLLQRGLKLRDRRDQGLLSPHGLAVATGRLAAQMDRLLEWKPSDEQNRRLLAHLRRERDVGALFTYLRDPRVEATNWRAEQAIRPAVVTRKVCGGNRTRQGANTQQVLASVLRTARQQKRDPYDVLAWIRRAPGAAVYPAWAGHGPAP